MKIDKEEYLAIIKATVDELAITRNSSKQEDWILCLAELMKAYCLIHPKLPPSGILVKLYLDGGFPKNASAFGKWDALWGKSGTASESLSAADAYMEKAMILPNSLIAKGHAESEKIEKIA